MDSYTILKNIEKKFNLADDSLIKIGEENFGDMDDFVREIRITLLVTFVVFKYSIELIDADTSLEEKRAEFKRLQMECTFINRQLCDTNFADFVAFFKEYLTNGDLVTFRKKLVDFSQSSFTRFIKPLLEELVDLSNSPTFDKDEFLGLLEIFPVIMQSNCTDGINEVVDDLFKINLPDKLVLPSLEFAGYTHIKVFDKAEERKQTIMQILEKM